MSSKMVLVCMLIAIPAQAAVNMISVHHRVWGDAGQLPDFDSYDQSATGPLADPLSGSAVGRTNWGFYTDENFASSTASDWAVQAFRFGGADFANAYARNTYVFQPFSRVISLSLHGVIGEWWFENQAKMTLTDLSVDHLVSSYHSPSYSNNSPFDPDEDQMQAYHFHWDDSVDVDPDHLYELVIYVGARRGEGGDGSASLNLTIVPEPASLPMAGMGVLIICWRRRCRS